MITTSTPAAVAPCKRGHVSARDKDGNCIQCRREHKRKAEAKRRAKAKAAMSRVAAPTPTPTQIVTLAADAPAANVAAQAGSFLAIAQEYLSAQDDLAPNTLTKRQYLLAQLQSLHDRPIAELTTPDYVRALKAIEAQGDRRETAHRAGMFAGQVTRYAMNHGYVTSNALPSGQLRGTLKPVKTESHASITDPRDGDNHDTAAQRFGRLLRGIVTYELTRTSRNHPSVGKAIALAPYVFLRPGELRQLEWSDINGERAELVIPESRTKMRRQHLVPLSRQALILLREQQGGPSRYVFPAKARTNARKGDQPISENSWREALDFVLALMREPRDAHTVHGFRSAASTLLNGMLKFDSELIELQLAHQRGGVKGVYDRSQRVEERREMMQRWADYIDQLRANVKE